MSETRITWSEDATDIYQRIAQIAVPQRADQIAAMLSLMPYGVEEAFVAVELGSGEGRLAAAILDAFPHAHLVALDGSHRMRETTRDRLRRYEGRYDVQPFDLLDPDWLHRLDGAGCVVSSLVVHHLDDHGKQSLFREIATRSADRSVLLIADLLEPKRAEVRRLFAESYERIALQQSIDLTGDDSFYRDFVNEEWNFFRFPDDDADIPSPLYEQLQWLDAAGYADVDCFWMQAGHAIYGGFRGPETSGTALSYDRAIEIAQTVTQ